ncbi:MAG: apolipoprotein N-acyltransferase [Rhodothermales bacterium]|jgi:apolipoprotein N-acyltransferase
MPCLFAAIALITPRLFIAYLWFFTHWIHSAFDGGLMWPVLGFFFAPTSLLWYSVVQNAYDGEWGTLQIALMVVAVLIDVSPSSSKRKRKK